MSRAAARTLASALLALGLLVGAGAAGAGARGLEGAPESFAAWVESLPEAERHEALRRLDAMPAHRRTRLFRRWDTAGEAERRLFQRRMFDRLERRETLRERVERMPPESRERLAPLVRRWREMGPDDRRRMRRRLERFGTLSPEAQQALVDRRFGARPPEERARILEALRNASRALPERPPPDAPAPGAD